MARSVGDARGRCPSCRHSAEFEADHAKRGHSAIVYGCPLCAPKAIPGDFASRIAADEFAKSLPGDPP